MHKILLKVFCTLLVVNEGITMVDDIPLLAMDDSSHQGLRRRRMGYKELGNSPSHISGEVPAESSCKNDEYAAVKNDEELFSPLGDGWELFKKGDYKSAFQFIYPLRYTHVHGHNPLAYYLVGEIFENGLGKCVNFKEASKYYTLAHAHSSDLWPLKEKAIAGLNRIITKSSPQQAPLNEAYQLEVYRKEFLKAKEKTLEREVMEEKKALALKANLEILDKNTHYTRENLNKFLKYLNKDTTKGYRYPFGDISTKTGIIDDMTVCKLILYPDKEHTINYKALWESLKNNYPNDYTQFLLFNAK